MEYEAVGPHLSASLPTGSARPREASVRVDVQAPRPSLLERLIARLQAYLSRPKVVDERFRWNVGVQQIGAVHPETVYCIELPASDPVGLLTAYLHRGVRPDHVVFVGDPLTMKDEAYYAVTRKGALVHEAPKKGRREHAEQELSAYYTSAGSVGTRPTANPNPYTYNPGPPKVTPEQLQQYVDAIAQRRR